MARIMLVCDLFPLKFAVLEVSQQGQVVCCNVQTSQYLGHFIFIKRFNAADKRLAKERSGITRPPSTVCSSLCSCHFAKHMDQTLS